MKVEEIKQAIRAIREFCESQKRCSECTLKHGKSDCFCEHEDGQVRLPDSWKIDWSDE